MSTSTVQSVGARHEFTHDTELRLTHVTSPQGLTWSYSYDRAGLLTAETDFDGRTLGYTYDGFGRLASRANGAGQTVRYARDAGGRLVAKDTEGAVTRFSYNAQGHLAGAISPDSELSYVRDVSGRALEETVDGRTLTRAYDAAGRPVRRTAPSGAVSSWSYPAGSTARLDASEYRVDFEFDASGLETTRRVGATLTIDHAYDAVGRLTGQHVRTTEAGLVQQRAYTYRPDGYLTAVDDRLAGHREFELTAQGRVTGLRAENWTERYAYDEAGNQTHASWPGAGTAEGAREYSSTRIVRAGAIRYEHDAQGRVVPRQKARLSRKPDTWRYDWDAEDRLIAVTTPDGTRWRYPYDASPRGRRGHSRRGDAVHLGRRHPLRAVDPHSGRTGERRNHLGPRRLQAGNPGRTPVPGQRGGRPPLLRDRHGSGRHSPRTRRRVRRHRLAHPRAPVGNHHLEPGRDGVHPAALPRPVLRPGVPAPLQPPPPLRPRVGPLRLPDPLGLVPAPNPVSYVENPTRWIDPLGLAGCPHRGADMPRHSVVLGPNRPPTHASNELARYLRNDPDDPDHDPNRQRDPGATRTTATTTRTARRRTG